LRSPGSAGPPSGADVAVAVAVKDHAHDQVNVNVSALVCPAAPEKAG
jgi:hypothetical protein